ncbi:MAG: hypothetical protein ACLTBR_03250 [Anaerostipes sp.]|uniref:hypothetical protein n=1 Tax=Anaerostipes sp. TaxID=1872530 RepID=UPI0039923697
MLNITISGKELNNIINKVVCILDKKSPISFSRNIMLQCQDGKVAASAIRRSVGGYNFLKVDATSTFTDMSDGKILLDEKAWKLLSKMNGEVKITMKKNDIVVNNGTKTIKFKNSIEDFPDYPEFPDESSNGDKKFEFAAQMTERDFYEIITNMSSFAKVDTYSLDVHPKPYEYINFNMKDRRIESTDGARLAIKYLQINNEEESQNFMLHKSVSDNLKKVLDKKSDLPIAVEVNKEYCRVSGNDFTYYELRLPVEYYKTDVFLNVPEIAKFRISTKDFLTCVKYYADNVIEKKDKKPLILNIEQDKIVTYAVNSSFSVNDEIAIHGFTGKGVEYGFNSYYLLDALKLCNSDVLECKIAENCIILTSKDYLFMVLMVYIGK